MELTEFLEPATRCHDVPMTTREIYSIEQWEAADLEGIGVGQFVADYCS